MGWVVRVHPFERQRASLCQATKGMVGTEPFKSRNRTLTRASKHPFAPHTPLFKPKFVSLRAQAHALAPISGEKKQNRQHRSYVRSGEKCGAAATRPSTTRAAYVCEREIRSTRSGHRSHGPGSACTQDESDFWRWNAETEATYPSPLVVSNPILPASLSHM
jgi:hypothetical protein